jgi:hypothetical protein
MAETVGLIASVIQVAGAGLKLSQTLYQYVDGVATADRRIRDIAKEIQLTSFVIEELGEIFKNDETSTLLSKNAVKTANETMKECSSVFTEIDATLKKSKKNTFGRLMLPFRDTKIELLRNHIDKLKSTLQLLMQVLTYAHQVADRRLDRDAEVKQKARIQELIELKKESTRRYEASRRNLSLSEGSTLNDDRGTVPDKDDRLSMSTRDLTMAAEDIGSTINAKALETCVRHIRMLLEDIENLQQAFTNEIDGDHHSHHHQNLVGSYLRARDHLEGILFSGSNKMGVKLATPDESPLNSEEHRLYSKDFNTESTPVADSTSIRRGARTAGRPSKAHPERSAHGGHPPQLTSKSRDPILTSIEQDEWAYSNEYDLDPATPAHHSVGWKRTDSQNSRIEIRRPLPRPRVRDEDGHRPEYSRRASEFPAPEVHYTSNLHRTRSQGHAPAPNVTIYNTSRLDNESRPNVRTENRDSSADRGRHSRRMPGEWGLEDEIAELQLEMRRDAGSKHRDNHRHYNSPPRSTDLHDYEDKIQLTLAYQRLKEAEDAIERERHEDEMERRKDLLRRKLEIKYIKDKSERETEEDRIRLHEDRFRREWELGAKREEEEREQRTRSVWAIENETVEPQRRSRRNSTRRRSESNTHTGVRHRQTQAEYVDSSGSDYDDDEWAPGHGTHRLGDLQRRPGIQQQRAETRRGTSRSDARFAMLRTGRTRRNDAPQPKTTATEDSATPTNSTAQLHADVRDDTDPSMIPLPPSPFPPRRDLGPGCASIPLSYTGQDAESSGISDVGGTLVGSDDEGDFDVRMERQVPGSYRQREDSEPLSDLSDQSSNDYDMDVDSLAAESAHSDALDDLGTTSPTSTRLDEVDELLREWTTVF